MKRLMLAGAAAFSLLVSGVVGSAHAQQAPSEWGQAVGYSQPIGTTAVKVLPAVGVRYESVLNNVTAGTTNVIWCSYQNTAPAANAAGSFPLAPGGLNPIEHSAQTTFVNTGALWCVATAAGATLSASAFPQ